MLRPTSIEELQDMVTSHDCVLAVGGGTKTRLTTTADDVKLISMAQISGMTEYEPSEYTFTALAGTRVSEIHTALQAKGQFLPCSALLRDSGATLGGAIASGLSGPGRFRFGGLRDFLLGIRYVAGDGKVITGGGKVVKNAAGFDLPKFMVGSLGRYGILTEVTFKVFPAPTSLMTLRVRCGTHREAVDRMIRAAAARWELYAIDYDAAKLLLHLRLGGPSDAIESIAREIHGKWQGDVETLTQAEGEAHRDAERELRWVPEGGFVAKVPLTPKRIPALQDQIGKIPGLTARYAVAGNVALIAADHPGAHSALNEILSREALKGMTIIGSKDIPLWLSHNTSQRIEAVLKNAIDPHHRFPPISDH